MMKRFECLTDEKVVGFGVDMERAFCTLLRLHSQHVSNSFDKIPGRMQFGKISRPAFNPTRYLSMPSVQYDTSSACK